MRRFTSIITVTLIMFGLFLTGRTATVRAEAPSNDTIEGAIWLGFPDSSSTSTTEATQDELTGCGWGGPSVWYAFAGTGSDVVVNTAGSDFDTVLTVLTDYGYGLEWVTCNDDWSSAQSRVSFYTEPGRTYYFLVEGYGWSTGNLTINTVAPPPPFTYDLTLNPTASINSKTGVVTISGTATCSTDGYVNVWGELMQRVGRTLNRASNSGGTSCAAGTPVTWSIQIQGYTYVFAAGSATVQISSDGSGNLDNGFWSVYLDSTTIRITAKR